MTHPQTDFDAPRHTLVNRLRQFVVDAGLRWATVAKVIGVTPATLSRWTSGDTLPSDASAALAHHRLDVLYSVNESTGLFQDLHDLSQDEKATALRGALYKSTP